MLLNTFSDGELRNASREIIETLEYWLRRVVDKIFTDAYGEDYFNVNDDTGARIIKKEIGDKIDGLYRSEPARYARKIDASLLDVLVDIICNPRHYQKHFKVVFESAFPEGNEEARTFFKRLIIPRNHLSHTNPITIRHAEQILCYSHDIIDSIKAFYTKNNLQMSYNVPRFVRFKDSFGNEVYFDQNASGHPMVGFIDKPEFYLRPGDYLTLEVVIDESFDSQDYTLSWGSGFKAIPKFGDVRQITLRIESEFVAESFNLQCRVKSNKTWHRMVEGIDDLLLIYYRVLPPL